jgi:LuxR family maltose regulon positive regulatory protein
MAIPLLTTKLYIPPPQPKLVSRPRLIERLDAGISRKLTLVSAPAGFGKTTLLSEWIGSREYRVGTRASRESASPLTPYSHRPPVGLPTPSFAWLSLDEDDSDPTRFMAYLCTALRTIPCLGEVAIGETAMAMLQSPQPPPIDAVLTSLINEIAAIPASHPPLALVLDDYHRVETEQIRDILTFVLDHLPLPALGGLHLVIATRKDPLLSLAQLRVSGEITEIRARDLRFTIAESSAFFNQAMDLGLSPDQVSALEARTEGWIAGLHLAALSLRGRADRAAFIQAFAGNDRHVMDYLTDQVLSRQPQEIQNFMLYTAILERLCGPLCDAVMAAGAAPDDQREPGRSQGILEHLEQANLFVVPLDNKRDWYRYHHMFADLLRLRLQRAVGTKGLAPLHLQASKWYGRNGFIPEAVNHALAAPDYERAVHLIEGSAKQMFMRSELATILQWVDALPTDRVRSRPWLCIYAAWSLRLSGGQPQAVESWLQDAERALKAYAALLSPTDGVPAPGTAADEIRTMRGHIATLRAYQALYREQMPRTIELASQALENLPEEGFVRGLSALALGWAARFSGDLEQAKHAFAEATSASLASGNRYVAVAATSRLAYTWVLAGRLRRGAASCREALQLTAGKEGRRLPVAGYALVYLGGMQREWNDLEAAAHTLLEGIDLCAQVGYTMDQIVGHATLARVRQAQGDEVRAGEALRNAERLSQKMRGYVYARRWVEDCQVRLWIAQGRLEAVADWVRESGLGVEDEITYLRELEHLILARALVALGRDDPQSAHLEDALKLLARLLEAAESAGWMGKVTEILILQALATQARGEDDQALVALGRALALAEPEGYVRVYLDEGPPMAHLLRQAAAHSLAPDYARRLLAAFEGMTKDERLGTEADEAPVVGRPSSVVQPTKRGRPLSQLDPLSDRELEVLRLIAQGLTNREIASRLYLAQSTVKVHTRNIYGKLDVHSRTQAVAYAQELGLLS